MEWLGLVMQIAALLLADKVDPNQLSHLLGRPAERSEKRWQIEPEAKYRDLIRSACLHIEKLHISGGLVTTFQIDLAKPWRTSLLALQQDLGSAPRELPLPPATILPGGSYEPLLMTFAYDIERDGRHGVVLVTAHSENDDFTGEIEIVEIRVRRYYE